MQRSHWALMTNHAAALLYVARYPTDTIREIGDGIGVTERTAARILRELQDCGLITKRKDGRANRYSLGPKTPGGSFEPDVPALIGALIALDVIEEALWGY